MKQLVLQCDGLGESMSQTALAVVLGFEDTEGSLRAACRPQRCPELNNALNTGGMHSKLQSRWLPAVSTTRRGQVEGTRLMTLPDQMCSFP